MEETRHLTAVFLCTVFMWIGAAIYILHAFLPPNPIELPFELFLSSVIHQGLPQGWGFFTKSPRDSEFMIYASSRGKVVPLFRGPAAEPVNFFGLSRFPRIQGGELAYLGALIPEKSYYQCRTVLVSGGFFSCRRTEHLSVFNALPFHDEFCENMLICRTQEKIGKALA